MARGEEFKDIAGTFEAIAVAEKEPEKRYLDLAGNMNRSAKVVC
jgi:rubrerythrin